MRVIFVVMIGMGDLLAEDCDAADENNDTALNDMAAFPEVTEKYRNAVSQFLHSHRSDNSKRNYQKCLPFFYETAKSSIHSELKMRSHWFLAFIFFLQRDFSTSCIHAKQTMLFGKLVLKNNPLSMRAENLASKLDEGEASFDEVLVALTAQEIKDSALIASELRHYFQTSDPSVPAMNDVTWESLQSAIVIVSIYASATRIPLSVILEKVHQAECVSRLHALIKGWRKYFQNHGKPVPVSVKIGNSGKSWEDFAAWPNLMQAYIDDPLLKDTKPLSPNIMLSQDTTLVCPSRVLENSKISSHHPHFAMNNKTLNSDGKVISDKTMIFIDSKSWYVVDPSWGMKNIDYRHSGGVNCAFADGHVDWLSQEEITTSAREWKEGEWSPVTTN